MLLLCIMLATDLASFRQCSTAPAVHASRYGVECRASRQDAAVGLECYDGDAGTAPVCEATGEPVTCLAGHVTVSVWTEERE